ncbi:hypothetical protein D3C72_1425690 [compost metagenome]
MNHVFGIIFLVLVFSSSSFAKSTTSVNCSVDEGQADFNVRLVNNKIEFARYLDEKDGKPLEVENAKVVNSDKLFTLTGLVNKKSFRLEVNLNSQDGANGNLNFAQQKKQSITCLYSETGLNI